MNPVDLSLAVASFGSAIWGALRFFRTEDSGARTGRRLVSIVVGTCMIAGVFLLATTPGIPSALWRVVSRVAFVAAVCLFWWTWWATRRDIMQFAFSSAVPNIVRMSGPYRFIRHPYYSSYLLAWIGLAIALPGVVTLAILCVMVSIYVIAARSEEAIILGSASGTSYRAYMQRTGQFMPRLWRTG